MELPKKVLSSTEIAEPNRPTLRTLKVLPTCT